MTVKGTKEEERVRAATISALGNAVVPQIPYILISSILEIERQATRD